MGIGILVADDHKLLRDGFRSLISEQTDMTVVGEAEDGRSAVQLAARLAPDLVIMDISMPGMNGIEATRRILDADPSIRVMALSMHLDRRMVLEMIEAGATGYLLKECAFDEVIRAAQVVAGNGVYLSARVADALLGDYLRRVKQEGFPPLTALPEQEERFLRLLEEEQEPREIAARLQMSMKAADALRCRIVTEHIVPCLLKARSGKTAGPIAALTHREREILVLVKDGRSTADIAGSLKISQDTVKYHMKNVFQKLGAASRSQAIAVAMQNKLIDS